MPLLVENSKHALSSTPEWQLVERIVASSGFSRSSLLTNFLLYICERKLTGREDEITESQIGIQALGRPGNYNPGDDNIVRSYARMLRTRLDAYFAVEGQNEDLRIHIPRGNYVPVFSENSPTPAPKTPHPPKVPVSVAAPAFTAIPAVAAEPEVEGKASSSRKPLRWLVAFLASGVVLLAAWFAMAHRQVSNQVLYTQFWSGMLNPTQATNVITADSGFAMLQDLTGHQVHLHEYVSGNIEELFPEFSSALNTPPRHFGAARFANYTSTADLNSVLDLARLPMFHAARVQVRYARDVRMDDLKDKNAIIIGGPHANPWSELYEPRSDFRLDISSELIAPQLDGRAVINKKPRPGEKTSYSNSGSPSQHVTYAVLSYLRGADREGNVLLFQGISMAATQAAADFATDDNSMAPILREAQLPDGTIGTFELLLETRVVGASAPEAKVVLGHYESHAH